MAGAVLAVSVTVGLTIQRLADLHVAILIDRTHIFAMTLVRPRLVLCGRLILAIVSRRQTSFLSDHAGGGDDQ
jgi:hypothetical protein